MMTKLALFDCDGTLVDSQNIIIGSMRTCFATEGLAVPGDEAVRRIVGLSLPNAIAHLWPQGPQTQIDRMVEIYKQAFFEARQKPDHHEPLFPGVMEVLDELEQAGWVLGIATGKTRRGLDAVLERHGLVGRFATLQTADRCRSKPDPEMLLMALDEVGGIAPSRAVMIGDTSYDILMARSAGAGAVGVSWGYHPSDELTAAGADIVIDVFAALHPVAERLVSR